MRVVPGGLGLLGLVALGGYLVVTEGGPVATGYAVGTAVVASVLTLRRVDAWLPPDPDRNRPLYRLATTRRLAPSRPAPLLEWEEALLAARIHGWGVGALGRRLAPVVDTIVHERRGTGPNTRAADLLGPTWESIRPGGAGRGAPAPGVSLEEIDELSRRLEAL